METGTAMRSAEERWGLAEVVVANTPELGEVIFDFTGETRENTEKLLNLPHPPRAESKPQRQQPRARDRGPAALHELHCLSDLGWSRKMFPRSSTSRSAGRGLQRQLANLHLRLPSHPAVVAVQRPGLQQDC